LADPQAGDRRSVGEIEECEQIALSAARIAGAEKRPDQPIAIHFMQEKAFYVDRETYQQRHDGRHVAE
jgi:hypothetical protein